jgi:hypothetical protein
MLQGQSLVDAGDEEVSGIGSHGLVLDPTKMGGSFNGMPWTSGVPDSDQWTDTISGRTQPTRPSRPRTACATRKRLAVTVLSCTITPSSIDLGSWLFNIKRRTDNDDIFISYLVCACSCVRTFTWL